MGCEAKMGKCIVVTYNIVFLIIATALLAVGIILKVVPTKIFGMIDDTFILQILKLPKTMDFIPVFDTVGIVFIVFGAVLILLTILGFCYVCFNSKPFIVLYGILLLCLVIAEAALGGLILSKDSMLNNDAKNFFGGKIASEYKVGNRAFGSYTLTANLFAAKFECCGYRGQDDFLFIRSSSQSDWQVHMAACCNNTALHKYNGDNCTLQSENLHPEGCYDTIYGYLDHDRPVIIAVFIIVLFLQAVGVVIALVLAFSGGKSDIV